jgi:hypothetical protein
VVAGRAEGGCWQLVHGALLIVPDACAEVSWPMSEALEGHRHASRFESPLAATLVVTDDLRLLGRLAMSLPETEAWLGGLLSDAASGAVKE